MADHPIVPHMYSKMLWVPFSLTSLRSFSHFVRYSHRLQEARGCLLPASQGIRSQQPRFFYGLTPSQFPRIYVAGSS
jgi:hypothetical protein